MDVERIFLQPSGWVPNNTKLPVLLYKSAIDPMDAASGFEQLFAKNGWEGIWRNGVFNYHHYHSMAHEVLGVASGEVDLLIGGMSGFEVTVRSGDALALPAGTGHKKLSSTNDFVMIGAYPAGQEADIRTSAASEAQLKQIARVRIPGKDPIMGRLGPMIKIWTE